ncbi:SAG-related sequence [Besnoitia besnoiti]|uniref:SAG-related sequence n=1 Tax=Besnoitia besnoiti TaxID=94643 RepID=A0A2A9MHY3_BESBE|nr:SAG-related sequence [Besnoitia besnoiti]PFH36804.1 SAG-related sequence [Besnoitia besnoiti]
MQRKPFCSSRLCLTITLLFIASFETICKEFALSALEVRAAEQTSKCAVNDIRTKCTCETETTDPIPSLEAKISEKTNELEIHCMSLKYAPDGLQESTVCSADAVDVAKCKASEDEEKSGCIDVNTLLVSTSGSVEWKPSNISSVDNQSKVLSVPKEKLPYIDGQFIVGCSDSKGSTTKCKVAVTVAARATETKDQQVTCSYGKDSNKKHQTITLSPSQNSFTLVCGEKGEIVQTNYKKTYCDVSEENAAVKDCHGKYKDILPGYEEGWWTDGEEKSFTFTIPEDKFPKVGAKMMVQCQKVVEEKPQEKELQVPAPAPPQDSVCSVDVTIETGGSPSSASASFVFKLSNFVLLAVSGVLSMSPHFLRL